MGAEYEPSHEFNGGTLPLISEEVKNRIFQDLGLDNDGQRPEFSGAKLYSELESMTETVFADLMDINPGLVKDLEQKLRQFYTQSSNGVLLRGSMDAEVEGMALILRAYDLQTNHNLFERLGNINVAVAATFIEQLYSQKDESLLSRIVNQPRIPEQNVNLNKIVKAVGAKDPYQKYRSKGAASMYSLLRSNWHNINKP